MGFTASDGPRMTQIHCVICYMTVHSSAAAASTADTVLPTSQTVRFVEQTSPAEQLPPNCKVPAVQLIVHAVPAATYALFVPCLA